MSLKQKLYCHTLGCKMGFAVKGILRMLRHKFNEQNIDLTLEQYFMLNILDNEEGLILQELADIVDRDKSAVLRLINGLEENHFIARSTDPDDKRRKILLVTKNGSTVLEEARALDKQVNRKLTRDIDPEKRQDIEHFLSKIYQRTLEGIES